MLPEISFTLAHFNELSVHELYELLRLRSEIFVVEQNCVFLEMDNKDQQSWHLLGYQDDKLAAYSRLLPAGTSFPEMSIGRVVTAEFARGTGLGRELMAQSIATCYELFQKGPIRIGAQYRLKQFYESIGFTQAGEIYDEDGIDHVEMLLHPDGN